MKAAPPPSFEARSFDDRLDDWLSDTAFVVENDLGRVTREFFAVLKSAHTRKAYLRALQRFLDSVRHPELDGPGKITTGHIQNHIDMIGGPIPEDTSKDAHISTRALALAALRRYFGHLLKKGYVSENPADDATLSIPTRAQGKTPPLSAVDVKLLLRWIKPISPVARRDRALVAFLAYTGCRIGAALGLVHSGLRGDGVIELREKGNIIHRLPMPPALARYLKAYLGDLVRPDAAEPVFRVWDEAGQRFSAEPMPYLEAYHMVRTRSVAAGIKGHVTPHCFRVTAITSLITSGVGLDRVRKFANHKRFDTTLLYDRSADTTLDDVVGLVGALEDD